MSDSEARENVIYYLNKIVSYAGEELDVALENLPASSGAKLDYPVFLDEVLKIAR